MFFTETWFKQGNEANFNNFCAFHRTRNKGHGGVSIQAKNRFDINLIEDPVLLDNSIEQIW